MQDTYIFTHNPSAVPPRMRRGVVVSNSDTIFGKTFAAQNPDDLIRNRGGSLKLYQEMLRDPFVVAGLEQRVFESIGEYEIIPASMDDEDVFAARLVEQNFESYVTNDINPTLRNLVMAAAVNGWTPVEPVYDAFETVVSGEAGIYNFLKELRILNPDDFDLVLDEFNNIEEIKYRNLARSVEVDKRRVLVYTHSAQYGNPYGRSDLRPIFRAFYIKDKLLKWWAMYCEKYSSPFKLASYSEDARSSNIRSELTTLIRKWHNDDGAILPPGCDLKFLEANAKSDAANLFNMLISQLNREIAIGLTGGELNILKGDSRAEGEIHAASFQVIKDATRKEAQAFINAQIIPRIVKMNMRVTRMPRIRFFEPLDILDREKISKGISEFRKSAPVPKDWAYRVARVPKPLPGDEVLDVIPVVAASNGTVMSVSQPSGGAGAAAGEGGAE